MVITTLLLLVAVILFGLATFGVSNGRVNLVAAGLCLFALAGLLPRFGIP
jgi:hypothetical protein